MMVRLARNSFKRLAKQLALAGSGTRAGQRTLRFLVDSGAVTPSQSHGIPSQSRAASRGNAVDPATADIEALVYERDALQDLLDRFRAHLPQPTFEDLAEALVDDTLPPLDRAEVDLSSLNDDQMHWYKHGYVLKKAFVPDELLDAYWSVRSKLDSPGGWQCRAPYMHVKEVLDLSVYRPLVDLIQDLIGEPVATHLNLTGIVSSERNWHQDDYLNAPFTKGWYAAAWIAIDDIDPDSGPFQFVPGSHRWPVLRRDRARAFLTPEQRNSSAWAKHTEEFLNDVMDAEIERRNGRIESFIGNRGDVLIWHARLVHRGSPPRVPGAIRKGFIAHYCGINHWALGPIVGHHPQGGMYFLSDEPLDQAPAESG